MRFPTRIIVTDEAIGADKYGDPLGGSTPEWKTFLEDLPCAFRYTSHRNGNGKEPSQICSGMKMKTGKPRTRGLSIGDRIDF
jgi:hypothetical protein